MCQNDNQNSIIITHIRESYNYRKEQAIKVSFGGPIAVSVALLLFWDSSRIMANIMIDSTNTPS